MKFTPLTAITLVLMFLAGCGGSASDTGHQDQSLITNTPSPTTSTTLITGKVTYDRVPHGLNSGLEYANTQALPIRGAVIEAVDAAGDTLASSVLDREGRYTLSVSANTEIRIQIKSQLLSTEDAKWNFSVTDNIEGNKLYALQGSLASTGQNSQQIRNLHAPHGWTGQSYGETRSAAPFAILDSVYIAAQAFAEIDPEIDYPALELRWSPKNKPIIGNKAIGHIGTSAYFPDIDGGTIYILGDENRDTDEYDQHVIIHEWGHYFEHQMSRTDSIGGHHSLNDRLDPRVAFSEGWSNALSAIISGDPVYRDSSGASQNAGFSYNIESGSAINPGWFSEASIGAIIYDIFDNEPDQNDRISAGLEPIYNVLRSEAFTDAPVFATIFALADGIRQETPENLTALNYLLEGQSISGAGPNGSGEINSGAIRSALPIYKEVSLNGASVQLCSVDDAGLHNKLGNREFIFLRLADETDVTLSLIKTSGDDERDPDFKIWKRNQLVTESASSSPGQEVFEGSLSAGDYVIEVFDFFNINGAGSKSGDGCFTFTATG